MREAIKELIEKFSKDIKTRDDLEGIKRVLCKKYKVKEILNSDILKEYRDLLLKKEIKISLPLEKILRKSLWRVLEFQVLFL